MLYPKRFERFLGSFGFKRNGAGNRQSEGFVEKIKARLDKREKNGALTGLRELKKDERVKEVERCVKGLGCDDRSRNKLLLYGLRKYTGLSLKEAGAKAGGTKPAAVRQAVRRLVLEREKDKKTAAWIRKLECQM